MSESDARRRIFEGGSVELVEVVVFIRLGSFVLLFVFIGLGSFVLLFVFIRLLNVNWLFVNV